MRKVLVQLSAIAALAAVPVLAQAGDCKSTTFQRDYKKITSAGGKETHKCDPSNSYNCKVTVCFTTESTVEITLSSAGERTSVTIPRNNGRYFGTQEQIIQQISSQFDTGIDLLQQ